MREGKKGKKNQPSHWEGNRFSKRRLSLPKASLEVFTCGGWFSPLGRGPQRPLPEEGLCSSGLEPAPRRFTGPLCKEKLEVE